MQNQFKNLSGLLLRFLLELGSFGVVLYIILIFGIVIGYFVNIFKLIGMVFSLGFTDHVAVFILRLVGVIFGLLGGIVGWY